METIETAIEHLSPFSTVLVACNSNRSRSKLIELLGQRQLSILGPAFDVGHALTLASHAGADLAIIDLRLENDESGVALAAQLEKTWGIPSLLLRSRS